jgi:hypothetical protein
MIAERDYKAVMGFNFAEVVRMKDARCQLPLCEDELPSEEPD